MHDVNTVLALWHQPGSCFVASIFVYSFSLFFQEGMRGVHMMLRVLFPGGTFPTWEKMKSIFLKRAGTSISLFCLYLTIFIIKVQHFFWFFGNNSVCSACDNQLVGTCQEQQCPKCRITMKPKQYEHASLVGMLKTVLSVKQYRDQAEFGLQKAMAYHDGAMVLDTVESKSWHDKAIACLNACRQKAPHLAGVKIIPFGITLWNDGLSPYSAKQYSMWFVCIQ